MITLNYDKENKKAMKCLLSLSKIKNRCRRDLLTLSINGLQNDQVQHKSELSVS